MTTSQERYETLLYAQLQMKMMNENWYQFEEPIRKLEKRLDEVKENRVA